MYPPGSSWSLSHICLGGPWYWDTMEQTPGQGPCLAARPRELSSAFFFFIVKYNGASLRPNIPRIMFSTGCDYRYKTCIKVDCIKHSKDTHAIFIDDLSEGEAIQLKTQLIPDPVKRPYPLKYHERTQQIFPPYNSVLQKNLSKIETFTQNN